MRVISNGLQEKEVTCDYCKSVLAYTKVDVSSDYGEYGGDYIKLLDWFEETGRNYPIRIHSMNVVGVQNMRAIIQRNGQKEVN